MMCSLKKTRDDVPGFVYNNINSLVYIHKVITLLFSYYFHRTTLYWEPNLVLDGAINEIKIRIYNSDFAKKFKIVLEGITDEDGWCILKKLLKNKLPASIITISQHNSHYFCPCLQCRSY